MAMSEAGSFGLDMLGAGVGAALDVWGAGSAAREQFKYNKMMYKKRYQWQVKDMKKAGINPMLAFSQGAPVPSGVQAPQLQGVGSRAVSNALQARMVRAQQANLEADTLLKGSATAVNVATARESSIRAGMAEESLPYAAGTARENYWILASTRLKISNEAEKVSEDIKITEQNYLHLKELQPLLEEYQRLLNRVKKAEIPAAEAEAAFWNALPEMAWVQQLRKILPSFPKGLVTSARGAR